MTLSHTCRRYRGVSLCLWTVRDLCFVQPLSCASGLSDRCERFYERPVRAIKVAKQWTIVTAIDLTRPCCRQRDELQGQREGPLRGGRRVPLWHAEGGAGPGPPGPGGQAELPEESASGPVPADGQQVGHEALRQQEGAYEGTDQTKSRRSLGHPSLLQFSVCPSTDLIQQAVSIFRYRTRSGWKTRPAKKYRPQT